ncbi:MAG: AMP-binding protein, partial [Adlercreutzia sp.]|nr:AMP-binding protein [Adlercreutzia sp.]
MALRRSVLSYLEDDAARHSGRCAVIDEGGSCTYGQLYLRTRKVGSALAELGARHRAVVVYMEKGIDALSVMFGALCAGGFYVPVDPQVPAERLARIVGVLQDPLVIADELTLDTAEKVDESTGLSKVLLAEDLLSHPVDEALLACARAGVIDSDPAYVLFTSGSTGTPKGVAVSHRAIIDFIDDFVRLFGFEETDRVANQAPFDFDVSVKDIYGALACGCTLVVVPRALFSQPAALVSYLEKKQVTIMTWAVAALCLITSLHGLEGQTLSSVRRVMFSGEVMPVDHLRTWMDHLPEAVFVNLYGPTEVTCNCLYHIIDRDRAYGEGIPLGVAFPNRQVLLVGEDGSLVTEPGVTGEILVRGVSLDLG